MFDNYDIYYEAGEILAQERKPDTLVSILMEWQKKLSTFIQDNNIHQRMDTGRGYQKAAE